MSKENLNAPELYHRFSMYDSIYEVVEIRFDDGTILLRNTDFKEDTDYAESREESESKIQDVDEKTFP